MTFKRKTVNPQTLGPNVTEKWSPGILNEGFVPFPKKLIRSGWKLFDGEESMKDLAVILAVVDFKRPNMKSPPSVDYLAFTAGLSPMEFWKRLDALQERGFVTVEGGLGGLTVNIDGLIKKVEEVTGHEDGQ